MYLGRFGGDVDGGRGGNRREINELGKIRNKCCSIDKEGCKLTALDGSTSISSILVSSSDWEIVLFSIV
jgi:hypothetical protein